MVLQSTTIQNNSPDTLMNDIMFESANILEEFSYLTTPSCQSYSLNLPSTLISY